MHYVESTVRFLVFSPIENDNIAMKAKSELLPPAQAMPDWIFLKKNPPSRILVRVHLLGFLL